MIWFTSDTHYHHKNIVRGTSEWEVKQEGNHQRLRDFDTLEEHDDKLVANFNKVIKGDDTLYHLGDWSFGGLQQILRFRQQLNCKNIHLILGNHDHPDLKDKKAYLYYLSINKGRLYKIGISIKPRDRVKAIKSKSRGFIKSIEIVWVHEDSLYNCFKKEQEILSNHTNERIYFKWSTELFKSNILPQLN